MLIQIKLRELLKRERYSIKAVSDATGIHVNTLSVICNHKTNSISFPVLEKLCNFLKCGINDIIEYKKDDVA